MNRYLISRLKYISRNYNRFINSKLKISCLCYILVTISLTTGNLVFILPVLSIALFSQRNNLLFILIFVVIAILIFLKFNTDYIIETQRIDEEIHNIKVQVVDRQENKFKQEVIVKTDNLNGLILAKLNNYPTFKTGELLELNGSISLPQNKSDFNYSEFLKSKRIFYEFTGEAQIIENNINIREIILGKFSYSIDSNFNYTEANLLKGILYGDDSAFSTEFDNNLKNSGLSHIVSVSGFNFVILYSIVVGSLAGLINRKSAQYLSIPIVIGFLFLVGTENIPAIRATIMILLLILLYVLGKKPNTINLLLITIVIMLAIYPLIWTNISFILSFSSLIGLISFTPRIKALLTPRLKKVPDGIIDILSSTLAVSFSTSFVSIIFFSSFSIISIISNLLTLPFIPLTMFLGFTFLLGDISNFVFLSDLTAPSLNLLLSYLKEIINLFGKNDPKSFTSIAIGIAVILVVLLLLLRNDYKSFKK